MDWTDRHCRYFLRGFAPNVLLYTEMITAAAIVRGDRARLLQFHPEEHPLALQLGGSKPAELAIAAKVGEQAGYDEINLNCGCPSDRVASGSFGAALMLEPAKVADCVAAMRAAVRIPVTVKMRIGVVVSAAASRPQRATTRGTLSEFDEHDYEALHRFVGLVAQGGCHIAIIHARKAVLGGLSPKENREVPPLRYDVVRQIRRAFPQLPVVVNGGVRDAAGVLDALGWCDGVMLGREAYHRPYVLSEVYAALYPAAPSHSLSREAHLERMAQYASDEMRRGSRLSAITRHMLGLYAGKPGARDFRRFLSEGSRAAGAGAELLTSAGKVATAASPSLLT